MIKKVVTLFLAAAAGALPGVISYHYGFHQGADQTRRLLAPSGFVGSMPTPGHASLTTTYPNSGSSIVAQPSSNSGWDSGSDRLIRAHERLAGMDASQILAELQQLGSTDGSPESELIQQLMAAHLAQSNPALAVGYATSLTGDQKKRTAQTVLGVWTQTDPAKASEYFSEHLDQFGILDSGQREAAKTIAAEWGKADPESALDWAQSLPEEVRLDAWLPVMQAIARTQPDRVVEAINHAGSDYERQQLMQQLVAERSASAPQDTAAWIQGISDSNERSQAAAQVAQTWAKSDLNGVLTWVGTLTKGTTRDAAISALVDSPTFRRNPQVAMQWAASIQEEETRWNAIQRVASRWEILDPSAAQAWQAK